MAITCAETDCQNSGRIRRGLCPKHYKALQRESRPSCIVEGCDNIQDARNLCPNHYNYYRRRKWEGAPVVSVQCKMDDCEKDHFAFGYCVRHYKTHSAMLKYDPCGVESCLGKAFHRSLCRKHDEEHRKNTPCAYPGCDQTIGLTEYCRYHQRQRASGGPLRPLGTRIRDMSKGYTQTTPKRVRKASVPSQGVSTEPKHDPYVPGTGDHTKYDRGTNGAGSFVGASTIYLQELTEDEKTYACKTLVRYDQPEMIYEMLGLDYVEYQEVS